MPPTSAASSYASSFSAQLQKGYLDTEHPKGNTWRREEPNACLPSARTSHELNKANPFPSLFPQCKLSHTKEVSSCRGNVPLWLHSLLQNHKTRHTNHTCTYVMLTEHSGKV